MSMIDSEMGTTPAGRYEAMKANPTPENRSSESTGNLKMSRLRSACNNCHQSKLRCSGEKKGCSRCKRLSLACQYTVSMVGRASKKRKLRIQDDLESFVSIVPAPESINNDALAITHFEYPDSTASLFPWLPAEESLNTIVEYNPCDHLLNLSAEIFSVDGLLRDSWLDETNDPGGLSGTLHSQTSRPTSSLDRGLSAMTSSSDTALLPDDCYDQNCDVDKTPDSSQTTKKQNDPTLQLELNQVNEVSQNKHWPHIQALSKIIACLETQFQAGVMGIDKVMRVSKEYIDDMGKIMSLGTYSSCRSCKTLISTALELIVKLYEINILPKEDSGLNSQADRRKSPRLYFGVFELGSEEQAAIRNHIICKELQRVLPIVHILSLGCDAATGSDSRKRHQGLFSEIEHRVQTLISTLTDQRGL